MAYCRSELYRSFATAATKQLNNLVGIPFCQFTTGQRKMMIPVDFDVNSQKGVLEAKRIQVPLILAWALSIHKGKEAAL